MYLKLVHPGRGKACVTRNGTVVGLLPRIVVTTGEPTQKGPAFHVESPDLVSVGSATDDTSSGNAEHLADLQPNNDLQGTVTGTADSVPDACPTQGLSPFAAAAQVPFTPVNSPAVPIHTMMMADDSQELNPFAAAAQVPFTPVHSPALPIYTMAMADDGLLLTNPNLVQLDDLLAGFYGNLEAVTPTAPPTAATLDPPTHSSNRKRVTWAEPLAGLQNNSKKYKDTCRSQTPYPDMPTASVSDDNMP